MALKIDLPPKGPVEYFLVDPVRIMTSPRPCLMEGRDISIMVDRSHILESIRHAGAIGSGGTVFPPAPRDQHACHVRLS